MADARLRRRSVLAGGTLLAAGAPALLAGCSSGDDGDEPAAATSPPPLEDLDLSDWDVVRGQFALVTRGSRCGLATTSSPRRTTSTPPTRRSGWPPPAAAPRSSRIPLYDDPATVSADDVAGRVAAALRPETRVVALTWVHSSTGVKLPVRGIADAVAAANAGRAEADRAILVLDAVHGLGADAARPADLGCGVSVSGTHKWLFGPRGTGNTPGGYQAFEHRWAAAEAFAFHQAIGRDRVAARTAELATRLKDGLAEVGGVRLLDQRIVASVTPYREAYVRFGASIVTTPDQVDAAVEAVAGLAG